MGRDQSPPLREYLWRYGALIMGAATHRLWAAYYARLLDNYEVSFFWGYVAPFSLLSLLMVSPDIYRIARGVLVVRRTGVGITNMMDALAQSASYLSRPLFYVDRTDVDFFQICYNSMLFRLMAFLARFMFKSFPVVYYNVSAKPFLNWIDYLYLRLLRDLRNEAGARIVVALHFDETLYREGFFTDQIQRQYKNLFQAAERAIEAVIGADVNVVDERWFLERGSKGGLRFADYFFGIMIAQINEQVARLERNEINSNDFYRIETNLVSILPAILTAQKYGHLFILDYEGSFAIWGLTPFSEFKRRHRIFFLKCHKIAGPNGERLPSWSEGDGVNLTDDTDTIRSKINRTENIVVNAMLDTLGVRVDRLTETEHRERLFNELKRIKQEVRL